MRINKISVIIISFFALSIFLSLVVIFLAKENEGYKITIKENLDYFNEILFVNVSNEGRWDSWANDTLIGYHFIVFLPEQSCATCYYEFINRIADTVELNKLTIVVEAPYMKNNLNHFKNVVSMAQKKWPLSSEAVPYLLIKNKTSHFIILYNDSKLYLLDNLLEAILK